MSCHKETIRVRLALASPSLPRKMGETTLRFHVIESAVDASFWTALAKRKLEEWQLDESPKAIRGFLGVNAHSGVSSPLLLDASSLDTGGPRQPGQWDGTLVLTNTREAFEALTQHGRGELMRSEANKLSALVHANPFPSQLGRFLLVCFADLKAFTFRYWFAFPALNLVAPVSLVGPVRSLGEDHPERKEAAWRTLVACDAWRSSSEEPAWLLVEEDGDTRSAPLSDLPSLIRHKAQNITLVCLDPCSHDDHPGWPLRNVLVAAAASASRAPGLAGGTLNLRLLRLRSPSSRSQLREVSIPVPEAGDVLLKPDPDDAGSPLALGWERDADGKLAPRVADLRLALDPAARADDALALNVQLMKWRLAPDLDTQRLSQLRVLLLGAGTLGCAVARTLLGYGVRSFTFVDSGLVSFSNPARQSLFTHEDCLEGGRPKAEAAAAAMRRILPSVQACGLRLTIPSPGCCGGEGGLEEGLRDAAALDARISACDAVFLLTDSRESRWLPTLLARHHAKPAYTAALGFDSYLVMRHGGAADGLSCYFCADVCAAGDSTRARTLDQQCTVSRPGLAPIAGGLAAELCVAGLHCGGGSLGEGAHIVRGCVRSFEQCTSRVGAFAQCTACSPPVLAAYGDSSRRASFLRSALAEPSSLEDLTGLTEMHAAASAAVHVWEETEE